MIKPPSILPPLSAELMQRLGASRCSAAAQRMVKLLVQPAPFFSVKLWPNHGGPSRTGTGIVVFGLN